MSVLTGWCLVCGLRYACVEDWLDHRDAHPEEEDRRGTAWRELGAPSREAESKAWKRAAGDRGAA